MMDIDQNFVYMFFIIQAFLSMVECLVGMFKGEVIEFMRRSVFKTTSEATSEATTQTTSEATTQTTSAATAVSTICYAKQSNQKMCGNRLKSQLNLDSGLCGIHIKRIKL